MRGTSAWGWTSSAAVASGVPQSWWLPTLRQGAPRWGSLPGTASHDSATWRLEADPGTVKVARELAVTVVRDWGMSRMVGDVELVVSELVTNALRHAGGYLAGSSGYENVIQLSVLRRGGELVCAVRDGSDQLPAQREPDFMAETGRGLHLVSCFSRTWGAVPTVPDGKFVWALFA
ncbi:ATP-binding protein [Marinactinospora rubrisoli]|uniref:ATP-binding protein n=1 Tax=Marinactinospora rubrisoli TaxID=2715399 RepID=A0ABW2KKV9_9ACTN